MSAEITVTRNFGSLEEFELVNEADMREIGLLVRERIIRRTRQGLGPDGVPLQPLSPDYAAQKRAALGTDAPDLTVSGNMLNDLQIVDVEVTPERARVRLGWEK